MTARRSRNPVIALVVAALVFSATALSLIGSPAQASGPPTPTVRLVAGLGSAEIHLYPKGRYELHLPLYLAAQGGAFELWAQRASYDDPVELFQVVRNVAGAVVERRPITWVPEPELSRGLPSFLHTELTRRNGDPVRDALRTVCPAGYAGERMDDTGPTVQIYPESCWASPFTRGSVWGIDQGWATSVYPSLGHRLRIDPGKYRLTVSITAPYQEAFGIAPEDAKVQVPATAVKEQGGHHAVLRGQSARGQGPADRQQRLTPAPEVTPPDSALPDIEALPAWGIQVKNAPKSGRAFLNFGATAWNAGPGQLVVEGFRDPASTTMSAFQYFYDGDTVVGKLPAGELEYDARAGHDHWHFRDFAAYSLLDSNKVKVLDSGKEAFCLAPTDPIDLTVTNAEWRPWLTDLGTACGEEGSLWIREVLQTGWGDTYTQYRPGQSFEITDLPNGTYWIRVLANPDNVLAEASSDNNEALRKVKIHGKPGNRWVEVPAYGVIDTEHSSCGAFC